MGIGCAGVCTFVSSIVNGAACMLEGIGAVVCGLERYDAVGMVEGDGL